MAGAPDFERDVPRRALRPGGVYFIEDLHVGRMSSYEDTHGKAVVADIVRGWMQQLMTGHKDSEHGLGQYSDEYEGVRRLPTGAAFIACQSRACAIGKHRERAHQGAPE